VSTVKRGYVDDVRLRGVVELGPKMDMALTPGLASDDGCWR
jgi:hypothetical protein